MRKAHIYYQDRLAGMLEEVQNGFLFEYDSDYLKNPPSQAVSLNFPLRKEPYQSPSLFPFFDGLIPEGWYLDISLRILKIDPEDRFGILLATAQDCVGAVSIREKIP